VVKAMTNDEEYENFDDVTSEEDKNIPPHSHVLFLANGEKVYYDAPAENPHGPVPSEVNGVPVVSHVHAFGG
jgi:hypothetical protein